MNRRIYSTPPGVATEQGPWEDVWSEHARGPLPDDGRVPEATEDARGDPPEFSLELVTLREFAREKPPPGWLVEGVLLDRQATVVGGPMKSLKTSILLDLTISLGTGCPFLGRFAVPRVRRVGLISGETGEYVLRQNAIEICLARGVEYSTNETIFLGTRLPHLTNSEHLRVLRQTIEDQGLEVVALDPFYLSVLAGGGGLDPKSMFEVGALLADLAGLCEAAGCMPILCHHFTKSRSDPFGPPELHELAYGGIAQFMRQWILLARRKRFDATSGWHHLHMIYGGSFGHFGELCLDIDTGVVDGEFQGRRWDVAVSTPVAERAARQERDQADQVEKAVAGAKVTAAKQAARERELKAAAIEMFRRAEGFRLTKNSLRTVSGWRSEKVDRALFLLHQDGTTRAIQVPCTLGNGAVKPYPGYELVEAARGAG